jgi:FKBP-type peptidyl-prolyl cis-trans isomerase
MPAPVIPVPARSGFVFTRRVIAAVSLGMLSLVADAVRGQTAVEPLAPPAAPSEAEKQLGYALGYRVGQLVLNDHRSFGIPFDQASMARGLADAVTGVAPQMPEADFERVLAGFEAAMRKREEEFMTRMAAAAKTNLAKGREFLAANASRRGVVARPSGLQYEVLVEGAGPRPAADHIVTARYRGTRIDGTEFDGTEPDGEPATFPLRGVVPGWQEALPLMAAGSKWRLYLPPDLAYGEQGSPPTIEPNEVLIFEVELLQSRPATDRD